MHWRLCPVLPAQAIIHQSPACGCCALLVRARPALPMDRGTDLRGSRPTETIGRPSCSCSARRRFFMILGGGLAHAVLPGCLLALPRQGAGEASQRQYEHTAQNGATPAWELVGCSSFRHCRPPVHVGASMHPAQSCLGTWQLAAQADRVRPGVGRRHRPTCGLIGRYQWVMPSRRRTLMKVRRMISVSYTHLRAHET